MRLERWRRLDAFQTGPWFTVKAQPYTSILPLFRFMVEGIFNHVAWGRAICAQAQDTNGCNKRNNKTWCGSNRSKWRRLPGFELL